MNSGMKFKYHLQTRVSEYMKTCKTSILNNCHMNRYKETMPFSESEIQLAINSTVDKFCKNYNGSDRSGDVLMALSGCAKQTMKEIPYSETEAATKAGVVDYINYVAYMVGVDLAMYTSDLD